MNIRNIPFVLACSLALPHAACLDDPDDLDGSDLGEVEAEIAGGWTTASPEGAVIIEASGLAPRTGVLVGPDLLLTHISAVNGVLPGAYTVSWGVGTTQQGLVPEVRTARHLNIFPGTHLALVQTAGDFVNGAREALRVTSRTPAQLAGATVTCKAYSNNRALRRTVPTLSVANGKLHATTLTHTFEDTDVGGMCIEGGELVGVIGWIDPANRSVAALIPVHDTATWLTNMTFLAGVRDEARRAGSSSFGPLTLSFTAPSGTRMCLNVPWGWVHAHAAVNQFPCQANSDAKNEQVYLRAMGNDRYQVVFDHSGLCLNVPNGSTGAPVDLQQYPCQVSATNDRWGFGLHPTGSGLRFWPQSATSRSLGGRAGAAGDTPSIPVQQQVAGSPAPGNQRWFITWKPVR
ncbi:MAG: RICIN domain-containing protein [Kofleriaceae bacterium]|nr:RICIN domain-containing protein [Kofleriaceae bacterium]MCL4223171.1 RICIN domain-containing protein [Myxococcales bacterium]